MNDSKFKLHHGTFWAEIVCHFPYAVFSVVLSMIILNLFSVAAVSKDIAHKLFHSFHFMHILFAGTGAILTFRRHSKNLIGGILVGLAVPSIFCTLSDSLLPFLGGYYLGIDMHFHWCFVDHLGTILPFLFIGVINGYVLSNHSESDGIFYSRGSHFLHIFISSIASIFYLAGYGFSNWDNYVGFIFVYLIFAVLVPCCMADIVVPIMFAKMKKKG